MIQNSEVKIVENTVDGRNPAPVEVGSLSNYLRAVLYIPGGAGLLPPTVWTFS